MKNRGASCLVFTALSRKSCICQIRQLRSLYCFQWFCLPTFCVFQAFETFLLAQTSGNNVKAVCAAGMCFVKAAPHKHMNGPN